GAPARLNGASGACTSEIVRGASPSLLKRTPSVTWLPTSVGVIDTSEVLAARSGPLAWPVPLTENVTGPESVGMVTWAAASPGWEGAKVTGMEICSPALSCVPRAGEGMPALNGAEDWTAMFVTFTGSVAVRTSDCVEVEPSVVVGKFNVDPVRGWVT